MRLQAFLVLSGLLTLRTLLADNVRVSADTPAKRVDCQTPGHLDVTGALLEVGRDSFVLNLCMPTQDCAANIRARFVAEAPGLQDFSRYLKAPAYIHVTTDVEEHQGTCEQFMSVANVASWTGAPDPAGRGNRPYFAVVDQKARVVDGTWFTAEPCVAGRRTLDLRIGQTKLTLPLNRPREISGSQNLRWSARLLTAGACDSPQGWSFWIASILPGN
jgi:hypothetical protein